MIHFPDIPVHVRAWLYRVLTAASVVAIGFGVLTEEKAALILPLVAAVLGNGLATANTSTARDEGQSVLVVALVAHGRASRACRRCGGLHVRLDGIHGGRDSKPGS